MKTLNLFIATFILLLFTSFSEANEDTTIYGIWWSPKKNAKMKIFKATDGKIYGKVVWIEKPLDPNGKPWKDEKNDDPKLRSREIMNLIVIRSFSYDSNKKQWTGGKIYDAEHGDDYDCLIWVKDKNHLNVRGYIQIPAFGKTVVFERTTL